MTLHKITVQRTYVYQVRSADYSREGNAPNEKRGLGEHRPKWQCGKVNKISDDGSDNGSHYGKKYNTSDLNDMQMNVIQTTGAIWIPPTTRRAVFHSTRTMIQWL
uniref:Uncharacterized protein n=1 Tax=Solanum tuberosum TaxID=4113 RepID=M1DNG5_SOLTU